MQAELEAIKDAWDNSDGNRDEALARSLSDAFVENNPHLFDSISAKSLEQLCSDIDAFRAADMETEVWLIEAWCLHRYEPQIIGGTYQPKVRVPGNEGVE
jgi:hypothetical protein